MLKGLPTHRFNAGIEAREREAKVKGVRSAHAFEGQRAHGLRVPSHVDHVDVRLVELENDAFLGHQSNASA